MTRPEPGGPKSRTLADGDSGLARMVLDRRIPGEDEVGIVLAMEQGIAMRVFPDEASVLPWLLHGAS